MEETIYGDEYKIRWEYWGIHVCPKCNNTGSFENGEKAIYDASPPVRDKDGNILKIHIDPPPAWPDGRRKNICCNCGHLGHAIDFIPENQRKRDYTFYPITTKVE